MPPATSNPNGYTPTWSNIGHDDTGQWWGQRDGKDWVKLSPDQAQTLVRSKKPTSFETARDPARQGSVYSDVKSTLKDQLSGLLEQLEGPAWKAFKPGQTVSQRALDVAQVVPGMSEGQSALAAIQHFMEGANPQGNGGTPARTFANRTGDLVADLLPIGLNSRRLEQDADVGNTKDILAHTGTIAGEVAAAPVAEKVVKAGLKSALGVGSTAMKEAQIQWQERANQINADYAEQLTTAQADYQTKVADYNKKVGEVGALNEADQAAHQQKVASDQEAYRQKVQSIRDNYASDVAENNRKRIAASASQSAATTKSKTLASRLPNGPVWQRIGGMADDFGNSLNTINDRLRDTFNKRWSTFGQQMGNPDLPAGPIQDAVTHAQNDILKGSPESIKIFNSILDEGKTETAKANKVLDARESTGALVAKRALERGKSVAEVRSALAQHGYLPGQVEAIMQSVSGATGAPAVSGTIPFNDMRGYYTELNKALYGGKSWLPGDVYQALKYVQDVAEKQIDAAAQAKGQGETLNTLKSDYRKYMENFRDSDSPIVKLRNTPDTQRRLAIITGQSGDDLMDRLGKIDRQFGANIDLAGRTRSLYARLQELSGRGGTMPRGVEPPKLPAEPAPRKAPTPRAAPEAPQFEAPAQPNVGEFDAVEEKLHRLRESARSMSSLSRFEASPLGIGRIPFRRLLARFLANPAVQEYLSQNPK